MLLINPRNPLFSTLCADISSYWVVPVCVCGLETNGFLIHWEKERFTDITNSPQSHSFLNQSLSHCLFTSWSCCLQNLLERISPLSASLIPSVVMSDNVDIDNLLADLQNLTAPTSEPPTQFSSQNRPVYLPHPPSQAKSPSSQVPLPPLFFLILLSNHAYQYYI